MVVAVAFESRVAVRFRRADHETSMATVAIVGASEASRVGGDVGVGDGRNDGAGDGGVVGMDVGVGDGRNDGAGDGGVVGMDDGTGEGTPVGYQVYRTASGRVASTQVPSVQATCTP